MKKKKLKPLVQAGRKIARNLCKIMLGIPVTYPSFVGMTLDQDDVAVAKQWLRNRSRWYDDSIVAEYEKQFALWNESRYAFAFMGGRVALSACIYALGLKSGDEVILPGYTCVVVPNAFHFAGVKIIYTDIELDTYGLDASLIEEKITPNTKVILLQHLYGLVCRDYEKVIEIGRKHGLYVIEDCAQATGAEFKGVKVGNLGDIAFYSSEHTKIFNTIQGGMAVTNNDKLGKKLREYYESVPSLNEDQIRKQLHNVLLEYYTFKHPQRWWRGEFARVKYGKYQLVGITDEEKQGSRPTYYGCKMAGPIAALGINQLKKIDLYNEKRRQTVKRWNNWCDSHGYRKPVIIPKSVPVYLRYPVMVEPEKKKDTSWAYKELGVSLGVWFVSNIHPVDWPVEGCPRADRAVKQCVNFPTLLE